jgi:HSP20 family protein
MTILRTDPVRQLAAMEVDRLNRMFDDLWGRQLESPWIPPVDIFENARHDVIIRAELPGMKREGIAITVEQNVLTISGERRYEQEITRDRFHRMERSLGTFSRSFTLPATLDTGKITATYEDGVLTLTLPQREEAKPRQIAVAVN